MSKPIHLQLTLHASPSAVFRALTDEKALTTWFAEHAAISLEEKRYDFWGRFTPETPTREQGRHAIDLVEQNRRLRFTWPLRGEDTTVDIRLTERNGKTVLGVWHHNVRGIPSPEAGCYSVDDLWFLWLENLRRYIGGRPVARASCTQSSYSGAMRTAPFTSIHFTLISPNGVVTVSIRRGSLARAAG